MKNIIFFSLFILFSEIIIADSGDAPGGKASVHSGALSKGMVNPGFYKKPEWFKQSFLELQDDLNDANENNKRIILYFHQDGCPYCKKLLDDNFSRKDIVEKMKQHYDLLEINMWGDKNISTMKGEELSEKEFAIQMKVMFTPTLIILDQKGSPLFRMNGYYAPDKFSAVLDYFMSGASNNSFSKTHKPAQKWPNFTEYFRHLTQLDSKTSKSQAYLKIQPESFIVQKNDLKKLIENSDRPVMVLFEQINCAECNELHGDLFRRLPVYKKLKQFNIAQIDINSEESVVAPDGQTMTQKELANALQIQYTPSILFYEQGKNLAHKPVFRSEAYLKSFHLQAIFDYISSSAYLSEPEFQRFVQRRADKMREEGIEVELWD